jgi:hypothetical protein
MSHPLIGQIQTVLPRFLSVDLTEEALRSGLGPVLDDRDPARLVARPGAWRADQVTLSRLPGEDGAYAPAALELAFASPQPMALADLERAFGPGQALPGLAPGAPATYLFRPDGHALAGTVLVTGVAANGSLQVARVTVNRLLPEPVPDQHAGALSLVVFAPLAAGGLGHGLPDHWSVWEPSGLEALMERLEPSLSLWVADRLGLGAGPLAFTLRPASLDDLEPDGILWQLPPAAALLEMRGLLAAVGEGEADWEQVHALAQGQVLPEWVRRDLADVSSSAAGPDSEASEAARQALVTALDRALSTQLAAILSDPRVAALRASWLGLAWLAENLDPSDGSRLVVYPYGRGGLASAFQSGFLAAEARRPEGLEPALVLVDVGLEDDSRQAAELAGLARACANLGLPLAVSASAHGPGPRAGVLRAAGRLRLRPSLGSGPYGPATFAFGPPPDMDLEATGVWADPVWPLGAAVARGHARGGPPGPLGSVPLPLGQPTRRGRASHPTAAIAAPPGGECDVTFRLDSEGGRLIPALGPSLGTTEEGEGLAPVLRGGLVRASLRRLRHRIPSRATDAEVAHRMRVALERRLPGARVETDVRSTVRPGGGRRVAVRVSLPDGQVLAWREEW